MNIKLKDNDCALVFRHLDEAFSIEFINNFQEELDEDCTLFYAALLRGLAYYALHREEEITNRGGRLILQENGLLEQDIDEDDDVDLSDITNIKPKGNA